MRKRVFVFYYLIKPMLPRYVQLSLRRVRARRMLRNHNATWPVDRVASRKPEGFPGWPDGRRFAFVLTHDVEGSKGVERVPLVTSTEKSYGFHSSFNFVARDYHVPIELRQNLVSEGFEIGVHGLHHDGLLYLTKDIFRRQAKGIRQALKAWNSVGFRSPAMHHDFDALHELKIRYDSSSFDTDPFEPQNDGVKTIFPFWIVNDDSTNHYLELPYTLPQDFTLYVILRERDNAIWKRKLDWVAENGGMALLITHPDYMCPEGESPEKEEYPLALYREFLSYVREKYEGQFWPALPVEVVDYLAAAWPPDSAARKNEKICEGKQETCLSLHAGS